MKKKGEIKRKNEFYAYTIVSTDPYVIEVNAIITINIGGYIRNEKQSLTITISKPSITERDIVNMAKRIVLDKAIPKHFEITTSIYTIGNRRDAIRIKNAYKNALSSVFSEESKMLIISSYVKNIIEKNEKIVDILIDKEDTRLIEYIIENSSPKIIYSVAFTLRLIDIKIKNKLSSDPTYLEFYMKKAYPNCFIYKVIKEKAKDIYIEDLYLFMIIENTIKRLGFNVRSSFDLREFSLIDSGDKLRLVV